MSIELIILIQVILLIPGLLVSIYNLITIPRLTKSSSLTTKKVSVLIPARNEEMNILTVLQSVVKSSIQDLEVIVLDDSSTDSTSSKVTQFIENDGSGKSIKLFRGEPLPKGWKGKPWACTQLAKQATGDYLIFIDADVWVDEWFLNSVVNHMKRYNFDMWSTFPVQVKKTLGEKISVGLLNNVLLSFLPIRFASSSKIPALTSANGQMICFRREAYQKLGGHESVRDLVLEDVGLAKAAKVKGLKVGLNIAKSGIYCRMYTSLSGSINGFSKNILLMTPTPILLFLNLVLILGLLGSLLGLLISPLFIIPILVIVLQRIIIALTSGTNPLVYTLVTIPESIFILYVQLVALTNNFGRGITWKQRHLD